MRKCWPIFLLFLVISCGTGNPEPAKVVPIETAKKRVITGVWEGKVEEDPKKLNEGKDSSFLSERLGGFTLKLQPDGKFLADWRGLTQDGSWSQENKVIRLRIEHVFGKSRAQAEEENKKAGKPVNEMSWFQKTSLLTLDEKAWELKLSATQPGEVSVIFSRDSD